MSWEKYEDAAEAGPFQFIKKIILLAVGIIILVAFMCVWANI